MIILLAEVAVSGEAPPTSARARVGVFLQFT